MPTNNNIFQPSVKPAKAKVFTTLSMPELYDTSFPLLEPVIKDLLYPGFYILAGAPKTGKSFLMAQLAYHVAQGRELWNIPVHKSSVLYLALEDKFYRLQQRLVRMFDMDVADKLHMAVSANDLYNGLEEQLADFINKYPDVRLIIIDTLQKIRNSHDEKINYARDYNVGVKLKEIADKYNICLLVVHHTRKQQAEDSFEMISGSNGLFGAADGAMVLRKDSRINDKALLEIVGRDQPDQVLTLRFSRTRCLWNLEKSVRTSWQAPPDPIITAVASLVNAENPHWQSTAQTIIDTLGLNSVITHNALSRKIKTHEQQLLDLYGISFNRDKVNNQRMIFLQYEPQKQAA